MPRGSTVNRVASSGPARRRLAASSAHAQRDSPAGRRIRIASMATAASAGSHNHERAIVAMQAPMVAVHGTAAPGTKLVAPPYSSRRIIASRSDSDATRPHEAGPSASARYAYGDSPTASPATATAYAAAEPPLFVPARDSRAARTTPRRPIGASSTQVRWFARPRPATRPSAAARRRP